MNLMKFLPALLKIQQMILGFIYLRNDKKLIESAFENKTFMSANMTMQLNTQTQKEAEKVTENAKNILKKCYDNPEKLLKFIESKGTKIVKVNYANKILTLLGEAEGFLTPVSGVKAFVLTLLLNIVSPKCVAISFKTKPMFIMRDLPPNIYFLAHQFHHWLGYVKRLPGYDEQTMLNFKNVWYMDSTDYDIEKLSINEILSLKDAIARDKEAIDFVKSFAREFIGSKNSLNKIKEGQSVNI